MTDCDDSLKVTKCLAIVYYILVLINTIARNYKNNYFIEVGYIVRKSVTIAVSTEGSIRKYQYFGINLHKISTYYASIF